MPLSDTAIRALTPAAKPIKKADERGLFLLIQPTGGKLWRFKYRFLGKEKKLALGRYPDVSLKEARRRRDEARQLLATGFDPGVDKKQKALAALTRSANTFELVALEYLDMASRHGREAVTINKSRWLLSLLAPSMGKRPIAEITAPELLASLRVIEAKGHLETAKRMRSLAGRVFRYAVATARASEDPSASLKGLLASPKVKHHSAILEEYAVGHLMRAIEGYDGQPLVKLALLLTPHVFVRPGELRRAEWPEINFERAEWRIPAEKMKMREPHRVPLSRQSLSILKSAQALSGHQKYVFSSLYPGTRPMSENTINAALRRLGYTSAEMTAHGFRATASTLLNKSGEWSVDAIEKALAHDSSSSVRGTYDRGDYFDERVLMAQWWSDHLDGLRDSIKT